MSPLLITTMEHEMTNTNTSSDSYVVRSDPNTANQEDMLEYLKANTNFSSIELQRNQRIPTKRAMSIRNRLRRKLEQRMRNRNI